MSARTQGAPTQGVPTTTADALDQRVPRRMRLKVALGALGAVIGPGLIAGLSDDDPAGITTYSVLGTNYGYRLLWVLTVSTGIARDKRLMGEYAARPWVSGIYWVAIALITVCIVALGVLSLPH